MQKARALVYSCVPEKVGVNQKGLNKNYILVKKLME
jgi:hypothetical protein